MTRRSTLLAIAAAVALVGCPLPQPLPDYPEGQPVTPPRILVDGALRVAYPETIVRVPAGCDLATPPTFRLSARLRHVVAEPIVARWFVDYDPADPLHANPQGIEEVITPPDATAPDPTLRETKQGFDFSPYLHAPAAGTGTTTRNPGAVHVVELVVSNGFDPAADVSPTGGAGDPPLPFRTPLTTPTPYETQVYRWTFVTVPESSAPCEAGSAGCVRCP